MIRSQGCARLQRALVFCVLGSAIAARGQLETRSQFGTNTAPNSVVAADFDHDGKMDIAVASYYNSTSPPGIQVFLGKGDGTFEPPKNYDVDNGAGAMATGDLNHDGNPDLIAVNEAGGFVSVLLGKGDGTFLPPVNYTTPGGPAFIVLGDFNGDGNLDIATSDQGDSPCYCVSVLLGNGDGTFQEPAIITALPPHTLPQALTAGHFTGGKTLDLAVTLNFESQGKVQILLGNGDGTFRVGEGYAIEPDSMSIIAADLRNDRRVDLAVAESGGRGVAVLLGNGDGTFQQPVVYDVGIPTAVAAADLNSDGILDLVAASPYPSGTASIFVGNGDGTFKNAVSYPAGEFPDAVAVADFNGDGLPDVTIVDEEGNQEYVLLDTGVVAFSPTTPLNFKKQKHGTTSAPQTVTLTNTGKTELTISAMKAAGQFAMTSTCGLSVAAGANCTISVTFSPKTQGAKSGTLSILDSASSRPQVIELSGTGT
jgi:hypothetical protein